MFVAGGEGLILFVMQRKFLVSAVDVTAVDDDDNVAGHSCISSGDIKATWCCLLHPLL